MLQSDDKSQKDIQAEKAAAHEAREQMDKAAVARDRGDAKGAKEAADKAKEAADKSGGNKDAHNDAKDARDAANDAAARNPK
jgi:hypothetical protein